VTTVDPRVPTVDAAGTLDFRQVLYPAGAVAELFGVDTDAIK
jgi:hypothetical protein